MALNGKHVSLKNIIAKVYRDLGLKEEEDFINFIEWGSEALEHIGVFEQLETKSLCIPITFYKGELPQDLVYLNYVGYGNQNLLPTTNLQGPLDLGNVSDTINADTGLAIRLGEKLDLITTGTFSPNGNVNTYSISYGYIRIGKETGNIHISYQAMPMDNEGYPLVPDDVSFREAVYRYIVYKWLYSQYIRGTVSPNVYNDAETKWHWYCGQAGSKAQMPSLGQMESIAKSYLSLKPNTQQFKNFFEDLNKSTI